MKNNLDGLVCMMDAPWVRYEMLYLSDRCSVFAEMHHLIRLVETWNIIRLVEKLRNS